MGREVLEVEAGLRPYLLLFLVLSFLQLCRNRVEWPLWWVELLGSRFRWGDGEVSILPNKAIIGAQKTHSANRLPPGNRHN